MRIKAIGTTIIPNKDGTRVKYTPREEYTVSESVGKMMIETGSALEIKEAAPATEPLKADKGKPEEGKPKSQKGKPSD